MRWVKFFVKFVAAPIAGIAAGLVIGMLLFRSVAQSEIADRRTITTPNGIELLEPVQIGGVEQWLSIRGKDRNSPILLYVHGGPGSPMMPFAHAFQDPLEEHFVVVQWDQRGAGKSRTGPTDLNGITIDRMIEDTIEVSRHLLERFDRDKIVLLGHSWGSVLGVNAILRAPELYAAYVGVGQVVNMQENEAVTYRYTLDEAKRRGDTKALAKLEALAPYPDPDSAAMVNKIQVQRMWLMEYDGALRIPGGFRALVFQLFTAPEYSLADCIGFLRGNFEALDAFMDPLLAVDLPQLGTRFEVPMFIVSGSYDYQVPFEIAERWYDTLNAPHKEFLWLHESAHMPMNSEPEAFARALELRVLPVAADTAAARADK